MKTVLITGASGNIGSKLSQHFQDTYDLRLLDRKADDELPVTQADLSEWNQEWVDQFEGVDTVIHLAADPNPTISWAQVVGPNMDTLFNVFTAAAQAGVKRVVYASSNHAMGAYHRTPEPHALTAETPPMPGMNLTWGETHHTTEPYGAAKLMGERLGKCYADAYGLSTIALRIGWIMSGENLASSVAPDRDPWLRLMWISNRDMMHLVERCIEADPAIGFAVINGMSNNTGMRWDIETARKLIGYNPQDDVTRAGD